MANYINTRIRKSLDDRKWLVEGQNRSTYNWDTLLSYPAERERSEEKAKAAACNLALDFSKKERQAVTAYDAGGYGIAAYVKGELYKGNGR